jgi:hypothetical protein
VDLDKFILKTLDADKLMLEINPLLLQCRLDKLDVKNILALLGCHRWLELVYKETGSLSKTRDWPTNLIRLLHCSAQLGREGLHERKQEEAVELKQTRISPTRA